MFSPLFFAFHDPSTATEFGETPLTSRAGENDICSHQKRPLRSKYTKKCSTANAFFGVFRAQRTCLVAAKLQMSSYFQQTKSKKWSKCTHAIVSECTALCPFGRLLNSMWLPFYTLFRGCFNTQNTGTSYVHAFETGVRAVRRHDDSAVIGGLRATSDHGRLTQTDIATT